MKKINLHKWVIAIVGFISLCWFLIRVIPKPSRAAYPCQRAAFPLASAFVLWLAGSVFSGFLVKRGVFLLRSGRSRKALLLFLPLVALFFFLVVSMPSVLEGKSQNNPPFVPEDIPNEPMGKGKGVFPGRVSWVYSPEAAKWDGTGFWWQEEYTSQQEVDTMLTHALLDLTGAETVTAAWDSTFIYHNRSKGKDSLQYIPGEKIAVKLNLNSSGSHTYVKNALINTPQLVYSLCSSLIKYGVPDTCVVLYDAIRSVPDIVYNKIVTDFPGVVFIDYTGGDGRIQFSVDTAVSVNWSENLVLDPDGGNPTFLPACVTNSEYLINLASLKGHDLAGITLNAKNHLGSFLSESKDVPLKSSPRAAGVHPYITVHYFANYNFDMRDMGTYNSLVDLMGHNHLGGKTILYMIDGIYAAPRQGGDMTLSNKWDSRPFRGNWTSSIFLSFDGVAIESVGLDFLRSEPTMYNVYGNVDNYLHEAAMANDPPSGVFYDPAGTGSRLESLGVHEHWNNEVDKQYSRNLSTGQGIELRAMKISGTQLTVTPSIAASVNPDEECIILEWEDICDIEDYYIVERADNYEGPFAQIAELPGNTTLYTDTTTIINKSYHYRIRTRDVFGYSPYSGVVTAEIVTIKNTDDNRFQVFPNPADNLLYVKFESPPDEELVIKVFSMDGKLVLSTKAEVFTEMIELDISELKNGNYLLVREDNGYGKMIHVRKE